MRSISQDFKYPSLLQLFNSETTLSERNDLLIFLTFKQQKSDSVLSQKQNKQTKKIYVGVQIFYKLKNMR